MWTSLARMLKLKLNDFYISFDNNHMTSFSSISNFDNTG